MRKQDALTQKVKRDWEASASKGEQWSAAFLDLDVLAYREFSAGVRDCVRDPYGVVSIDTPEGIIFRNAKDADVLCLASGGGQQSAQLGLLGARVTVLDIAEGQLEMDRKAAAHYGYEVHTVQGDMRDLSVFPDESFDAVLQPISMTFVPDVRKVYAEVFRVLRTGGLYSVCHCNPATYPMCFDGPDNGWDGRAYRIAEPYTGGPIRMSADGVENMTQGEPTGEHRHLYRDIFNGLIELGFVIEKVWDLTWDEMFPEMPKPGTRDHERAFDAYFSILARKPGARKADA